MALVAWVLAASLVLCGSTLSASAQPESGGDTWTDKVDPWVLESGATGQTEFLVVLREQADVSRAAAQPTRRARGEFVSRVLQGTARRSQAPVLAALAGFRVEFRPFWIANMIWVRGDLAVVKALAERPDVLRVSANPSVRLKTVPPDSVATPAAPDAVEWGITKTGAPSVWALGYRGEGVVVAGQDTGYQWDHPALKGKYRGWDGTHRQPRLQLARRDPLRRRRLRRQRPWPRATTTPTAPTPWARWSATTAGATRSAWRPDAKWIGCRNMDHGVGTPATYAECFQWFLAPTDGRRHQPRSRARRPT